MSDFQPIPIESVVRRDELTNTIHITGDFADEMRIEDAFVKATTEAITNDTQGVITVNVSELDFMNSTGLRQFLRIRREAHDAGRQLVLEGVNPRITRDFEIYGVAALFVNIK